MGHHKAAKGKRQGTKKGSKPGASHRPAIGIGKNSSRGVACDHQEVHCQDRRKKEKEPGARIEDTALNGSKKGKATKDKGIPQRKVTIAYIAGRQETQGKVVRHTVRGGQEEPPARGWPKVEEGRKEEEGPKGNLFPPM
jgi:hypothetical protein